MRAEPARAAGLAAAKPRALWQRELASPSRAAGRATSLAERRATARIASEERVATSGRRGSGA